MLKNVKGKKIIDFILTGDVDTDDDVIDFMSDFTLLAIQLDDKYIIFESVEQYSKICISKSSNLSFHERLDDDCQKAQISLINLLIINGEVSDVTIDKIMLYNCEANNDKIICEAAKILLSNGQIFFFDPSNFWGFTIGGELVEKNWLDSMQRKKDFNYEVITIT